MTPRAKSLLNFRSIEFILMALIVAGVIATIQFWRYQGYLPAPFVFDINDTFMDWYNTAQYAHNRGTYDIWRSIYPPVSFIFLKLTTDPRCYYASPFDARNCDVISVVFILGFYVACAVVAAIAFYKNDRRTALIRSIAFAFCLPLLYAVERGNLITVTFVCFVIAYTNVVQSRAVRVIAAGLSINFKYYLLFPSFALLLKRGWRDFELIGISALAIYLVTLALFGSGTPFEITDNLRDWVINTAVAVWDQVYYSTTYNNLLWFDLRQYPVRDYVGSKVVDFVAVAIPIVVNVSRAIGLFTLLLVWLQPKALSVQRVALILMLTTMIAQSPGGYAEMFIIFLVFMEKADTIALKFSTICAYLIAIPWDFTVGTFKVNNQNAWLSGRTLEVAFGFNFGSVLRPGMLLLILWAICIDSIIRIVRAHRDNRPMIGLGDSSPILSLPRRAVA